MAECGNIEQQQQPNGSPILFHVSEIAAATELCILSISEKYVTNEIISLLFTGKRLALQWKVTEYITMHGASGETHLPPLLRLKKAVNQR